MVVIDGVGTFQAASPASMRILDLQPSETIGRTVVDFIHPDDIALTVAALTEAIGAEIARVENRYRRKDESYRWPSWTAAPEGDLIYATGRNVTTEKDQAEALLRAKEQLRQSQKMEAVGQLTGGLAHDFNNLLAGISGCLGASADPNGPGAASGLDRYINAAQGASKRAAALTHRLLAFSRRQTLDPKPTDVNRLVGGMEDLVRRTVGPSIQVEVVGASGLWPALVDPPPLENALLDLCINARDAMSDGGRLTIETTNKWLDERGGKERDLPPGQYLSLCVSDTGTGMTPEVFERAFDPFLTAKPIAQGTGLGLPMIYGFARQSGGHVRIYSEMDEGTTMCLYLPRHYGAAEETDHSSSLNDAPRAEQGQTVLVIDDEPTVRMPVTEVLEDLGYTAIEAADGSAGLEVLRSNVRIDLFVTDVGLPGGMNGRQVADAARVSPPSLPEPAGPLHHRLRGERGHRQRSSRLRRGRPDETIHHGSSRLTRQATDRQDLVRMERSSRHRCFQRHWMRRKFTDLARAAWCRNQDPRHRPPLERSTARECGGHDVEVQKRRPGHFAERQVRPSGGA